MGERLTHSQKETAAAAHVTERQWRQAAFDMSLLHFPFFPSDTVQVLGNQEYDGKQKMSGSGGVSPFRTVFSTDTNTVNSEHLLMMLKSRDLPNLSELRRFTRRQMVRDLMH